MTPNPDPKLKISQERRDIVVLSEITVAEKIKFLLQKGKFEIAEKIATESKCAPEIRAYINKERADSLYGNRKYKEAMEFYIKTIGEEPPSYVIEKYLDIQNIQLLIDYLEWVIEAPQSDKNLMGNNKDYTALLLNCYIKEQKTEKLEAILKKDI